MPTKVTPLTLLKHPSYSHLFTYRSTAVPLIAVVVMVGGGAVAMVVLVAVLLLLLVTIVVVLTVMMVVVVVATVVVIARMVVIIVPRNTTTTPATGPVVVTIIGAPVVAGPAHAPVAHQLIALVRRHVTQVEIFVVRPETSSAATATRVVVPTQTESVAEATTTSDTTAANVPP